MPVFLLFLAIPLIEIALFVTVGGAIGLWPTLALVLATALAGTLTVRAQGLATLGDLQLAMQGRGNPARPLAHGALILLAGLLLITPGFFTDTLGFLLLIPPLRAALLRRLAARITIMGATAQSAGVHSRSRWPDPAHDIIDAEATEITPDARPLPGRTRPPQD